MPRSSTSVRRLCSGRCVSVPQKAAHGTEAQPAGPCKHRRCLSAADSFCCKHSYYSYYCDCYFGTSYPLSCYGTLKTMEMATRRTHNVKCFMSPIEAQTRSTSSLTQSDLQSSSGRCFESTSQPTPRPSRNRTDAAQKGTKTVLCYGSDTVLLHLDVRLFPTRSTTPSLHFH